MSPLLASTLLKQSALHRERPGNEARGDHASTVLWMVRGDRFLGGGGGTTYSMTGRQINPQIKPANKPAVHPKLTYHLCARLGLTGQREIRRRYAPLLAYKLPSDLRGVGSAATFKSLLKKHMQHSYSLEFG